VGVTSLHGKDLRSDVVFRQADELCGNLDLALDLIRQTLRGRDGLLKTRRIIAGPSPVPLSRSTLGRGHAFLLMHGR
jgi:hypothetical protein